ncbi:MAG: TraB/GumN family protein [Deltaproteobacteria bacterium]
MCIGWRWPTSSVLLVRQVIMQEKPDCVCVELDEKRFDSLTKRQRWESLNLKEIIRKKQLSTLFANLVLASYQKKLGDQLGVLPGTELLEAVKTAKEKDIPVSLVDRDVRVTMRRAWHCTSFWKKSYLLTILLFSLFDRTEVTEEKLAEMRKSDMVSQLMQQLGQELPEVKSVLIDERDTYLSEMIKMAEGKTVVAVVGAGHVAGILEALKEDRSDRMAEISTFPPLSKAWKALGWGIPVLIIASLAWIGWSKGALVARDNLLYWIFANGVPSSLGAVLALAHPFTILGAFAAAPITSLTPVVGAGYVTAFIQVMVRPPVVREFETLLEDMGSFTGWWRNKVLRVLLAFILPGIGSAIGTWVGGYQILSNVF